MTQLMFNPVLI